jgi:hypothetical protein
MGGLCEIEGKAAPTAADVEHSQPVAEIELGREVALLGGLSLIQRHPFLLEIGAGILAVAVEEQLIKAAVEAIVILDIALRAGLRIELVEPTAGKAEVLQALCPAGPRCIVEIR